MINCSVLLNVIIDLWNILIPDESIPTQMFIHTLTCEISGSHDNVYENESIHRPDDGGTTHPETLVYFNKTTWRYIPEGSHLHTLTFFHL
jgi:hypothetical protein